MAQTTTIDPGQTVTCSKCGHRDFVQHLFRAEQPCSRSASASDHEGSPDCYLIRIPHFDQHGFVLEALTSGKTKTFHYDAERRRFDQNRAAVADDLGAHVFWVMGLIDAYRAFQRRLEEIEREYQDSRDRYTAHMQEKHRRGRPAWMNVWRTQSQALAPNGSTPKPLRVVRNLRELPRSIEPMFVYFLTRNDEIVYVGQTRNLTNRLLAHEKDKSFDRVFFIECDLQTVNETERHYIDRFSPEYNVA